MYIIVKIKRAIIPEEGLHKIMAFKALENFWHIAIVQIQVLEVPENFRHLWHLSIVQGLAFKTLEQELQNSGIQSDGKFQHHSDPNTGIRIAGAADIMGETIMHAGGG